LGLSALVEFKVGDAENLPFADKSFDIVISSHVLEHLPNFEKGWQELCRVARHKIIVALPTCCNLSALALLGGDTGYWKFSKRSLWAIPWGFFRMLVALLLSKPGVQEGYAGHMDLPHVWRFPWVMRRQLKHSHWTRTRFEASTFCLPYFNFMLPLVRCLDVFRHWPLINNFGMGSIAVFEPVRS
jgi:SAM-dependent methyltransferase